MSPDKLNSEQFARLKQLFQQAADLRPDARATFVQSVKQQDPRLGEELLSLLAAQEAETGVLDHPLSAGVVKRALHDEETVVQSQTLQSPGSLQPGQVIDNRYEIVDLLGSGGFGKVYTALDRRVDHRKVVLKVVIPPAHTEAWSERRFEDEVRSLARLDHPGVVGVYDSGQLPESYRYLVMQYIAGKPLDALLREGPLALDRGLALLRQLAEALNEAHTAGILHRDLKPANVIVRDAGQPGERAVLIDFGIARTGVHEAAGVHTTVMSGSPAYMAPEQFHGRTSPASDIFSLGATAFEVLRGMPLHKCSTKETVQDAVRQELGKPELKVPEPVREAIARSLALDPQQRFPSAREFGKEMVAPVAEKTESAAPVVEPPVEPTAPPRSWRRYAFLGFLIAAGLTWRLARPARTPPPEAPPVLELSASLSRRPAKTSDIQPYRPGQPLERGDSLQMFLQSPQPAYLYVFDQDAMGYALLFPGAQSQTPLTPGSPQRVPESAKAWIETDGLSPGESIVLVVSKKPLDQLEALRKFSEAPLGAIDKAGAEALRAFLSGVPAAEESAPMVWRTPGERFAASIKLRE